MAAAGLRITCHAVVSLRPAARMGRTAKRLGNVLATEDPGDSLRKRPYIFSQVKIEDQQNSAERARLTPPGTSASWPAGRRYVPVMQFGERTSGRVEAVYVTPDVVEQRQITLAALDLKAGDDVLDVGSGPGFLAVEMAAAVGPAGSVTGLDPSEPMLARARARTRGPRPAGSAPVEFGPGEATALPYADGSFGTVVSTQVYEYVAGIPAALAEAYRVLRPGGRLLVLDTDWDSIVWRSSDPARMRRVLAGWDEHLADPHLPRRLAGLLAGAGFSVTHRQVIPLLNAGYDPRTYSAGLIGFITSFLSGRPGVDAGELAAWAQDLVGLGDGYFFSLNRYLFIAVKAPSRP
jgi:arsenite methyltransferase